MREQAPTSTTPYQLLQWKHAIRLEAKGLRVSHGRKVTPHVRRFFGLRPRAPVSEVLEHVEAALAACETAGTPLAQRVELTPREQ